MDGQRTLANRAHDVFVCGGWWMQPLCAVYNRARSDKNRLVLQTPHSRFFDSVRSCSVVWPSGPLQGAFPASSECDRDLHGGSNDVFSHVVA